MSETPVYDGSKGTSLINIHSIVIGILTLLQVILVIILFWHISKNLALKITLIFLPILVIYFLVRRISYYKIFSNRIEKHKVYGKNKFIDSVDFSKIYQVRYEDGFGNEPIGNYFNNQLILFYTNPNVKSKLIKKERITIPINKDINTEQKIIDILRAVKENKIQVYVSTKYKRLLKELELDNWTKP